VIAKKNYVHKPIFARKEVSSVNYVSDGSGRDLYVIRNSGGTLKEYK
jgi:hypothetical protein